MNIFDNIPQWLKIELLAMIGFLIIVITIKNWFNKRWYTSHKSNT